MPCELSVNLNAVAMLRNRRDLPWPSVERFGRIALEAGAHGLTVHPRPDQRHVRFSDLPVLRRPHRRGVFRSRVQHRGVPKRGLPPARAGQPARAGGRWCPTIRPSRPPTTAGTSPPIRRSQGRRRAARRAEGMRVSLFADADPTIMTAAADTGCDRSSSTPAPMAARIPIRSRPRPGSTDGDGGRCGDRARPRPQCRPRSHRRQSAASRAAPAAACGGVDRPRADGRRAGVRHGRLGAPLHRRLRRLTYRLWRRLAPRPPSW